MKYIGNVIYILAIVLFLGMFVGIAVGSVKEANKRRVECEAKGGVFINTKHDYLCLKKDLVIDKS